MVYFPHPKRRAEALDAFGLLSQFVGVLVHDHGSACQRYQCLHVFCNAHHLRELIAIAERFPSQPWATDMIMLLCQVNAVVDEAQALETLPASNGEHLRTRYDTILSKAEAGNPPRPRRPGTRGRVKQSPACNLIRRLRERRNEVLRFLTDRRVPFDNNQVERDRRMPKLKQKASGCFRSDTGAGDFAIIRSCLSTLRKQSDDLFNSLVLTFQGRSPMSQLEWLNSYQGGSMDLSGNDGQPMVGVESLTFSNATPSQLRILAALLAMPEDDALDALRDMQTLAPWLGPVLPELERVSLAHWQTEHTRLFISAYPKTPCPPYESVYRQGVMGGVRTRELADLYRRAGLQTVDISADYLGTMLECAAYLREQGKDDLLRELEEEHLGLWLPRFARALSDQAALGLYQVLGRQLGALIPERGP